LDIHVNKNKINIYLTVIMQQAAMQQAGSEGKVSRAVTSYRFAKKSEGMQM
jgi:hypothetical protein